ncbi:MAG: very short patch repair endonuclease [Roseibium album]|uniref:very short patch repair endonuclease n=1 Tax=Roseibium album TaxID=311410 RepID=UPI0032ED0881
MADVVSKEVRSRMMSGIRGKDTKPELIVRKALHRAGFRFRLHDSKLPGKPDLVLSKYKVAIFVHGCFWHGHDCHLFRLPSTRTEFWQKKIASNVERDRLVTNALVNSGWRIATVWECALKGKARLAGDMVVQHLISWLRSGEPELEVRGEAI